MNFIFLSALANKRWRYEKFLKAKLRDAQDGIVPMADDRFDRYVKAYNDNFDELNHIVTLFRDRARELH